MVVIPHQDTIKRESRRLVPEVFYNSMFQVGEVGFAEQAESRSNLVVEICDVPPGGNLAIDEIADPDREQASQESHA